MCPKIQKHTTLDENTTSTKSDCAVLGVTEGQIKRQSTLGSISLFTQSYYHHHHRVYSPNTALLQPHSTLFYSTLPICSLLAI